MPKVILYFLIALFVNLIGEVKSQTITTLARLPLEVEETSGIIFLNSRLITHNDSGDDPMLYEIDTSTGLVLRRVIIDNAEHVDWEDICHDSEFIYIGDIGNNSGSRQDLKIYKIRVDEYIASDTVSAEIIEYAYADQVNFTPAQNATNFDAETLISIGDSLYIITKNWLNFQSNIYGLPKVPGVYEIERIDSVNTSGLITGGLYDEVNQKIVLSAYVLAPFVLELTDFSINEFAKSKIKRYDFSPDGSIQIEGIAQLGNNEYYLTAEENLTGPASLYVLNADLMSATNAQDYEEVFIYPNPTLEMVHMSSKYKIRSILVYDINGKSHFKGLIISN